MTATAETWTVRVLWRTVGSEQDQTTTIPVMATPEAEARRDSPLRFDKPTARAT